MSSAGIAEGVGATTGVICAAPAGGDNCRHGKNWTTQGSSLSLTLTSNFEESTAHGERMRAVSDPSQKAIPRSSQACPEPEQETI
jgi:hypothetical protein